MSSYMHRTTDDLMCSETNEYSASSGNGNKSLKTQDLSIVFRCEEEYAFWFDSKKIGWMRDNLRPRSDKLGSGIENISEYIRYCIPLGL
ncbi:8395_t:CDS:2 [Gigaspora margarita]|uniref:8395_t:CDS:1 n=1 Tax=Gigaspora margarita TaxID=4874 RepID=A0ABN7VJZ2_GIGMA|nr:8395_t:CDS:2 [Gigaspora margarita]